MQWLKYRYWPVLRFVGSFPSFEKLTIVLLLLLDYWIYMPYIEYFNKKRLELAKI